MIEFFAGEAGSIPYAVLKLSARPREQTEYCGGTSFSNSFLELQKKALVSYQ
jgi:hypothetical protein